MKNESVSFMMFVAGVCLVAMGAPYTVPPGVFIMIWAYHERFNT